MSTALSLANYYFELSNQSDFETITGMFDGDSTFCARDFKFYLGVENIMAMQRAHHGSYQQLKWTVNQVKELKSGVVRFDFSFEGINLAGETISMSGIEHVIIRSGKIRHIDVRANK